MKEIIAIIVILYLAQAIFGEFADYAPLYAFILTGAIIGIPVLIIGAIVERLKRK